ncbi:MAG: hypothetical protein Q4F01_05820 [Staphylococcus rostri]|uniref:hypothetical protein n=1 Tax=Staphylococcus rostri TaxID=522262 RepID=UPI0026DF1B80|nr:hypothetical protein [Staphylococcus rostri]MDO5375691.1 hypothetical protein [Staphylococcus rostri]
MAVDKWTLIGIPAETPVAKAKAVDFVLSGTSEFSHEFENELREKIRGNKKDWEGGVVEETIEVTFPYDKNMKGDRDFVEACKLGKQMRFWIINNKVIKYKANDSAPEQEGHDATFAYVIPESRSLDVDDEDEKIEVSLKVKLNSAVGNEPKLPAEIIDASVAETIVYETIGQATGNAEDASAQNI